MSRSRRRWRRRRPARVTFFETGIGDATLVELPDGRAFLVDAGIGWPADHILRHLDVRGIDRLEAIVITPPHLDHDGGIAEVVSNVDTGAVYHALERALARRSARS